MSMSSYEAERIEDALDALAFLAASPLPEMVRRQYEDAKQILKSHATPRIGQQRREADDAAITQREQDRKLRGE